MGELIPIEGFGTIVHLGSQPNRLSGLLVGSHAFTLILDGAGYYDRAMKAVEKYDPFLAQELIDDKILAVTTQLSDSTLGRRMWEVEKHGKDLLGILGSCGINHTDRHDLESTASIAFMTRSHTLPFRHGNRQWGTARKG